MSAVAYHITGPELLQKIGFEGPKAFEQLFDKLYPSLCIFAYSYMADREAAKDIVSELFLGLWKDQEKLQAIEDVPSYLYIAAKYRSLNHVRNAQIARKHESVLQSQWSVESEVSMEEKVLEAQYIKTLYDAVETLPAECKRVISLSLQGLSTAEIAKQLDITPAAVSNQKSRAIRLLRFKIRLPVWVFLSSILYHS